MSIGESLFINALFNEVKKCILNQHGILFFVNGESYLALNLEYDKESETVTLIESTTEETERKLFLRSTQDREILIGLIASVFVEHRDI